MQQLAGPSVTLLGNIPPRDILAGGTPDQVRKAVRDAVADLKDRRHLILSAGGGLSPNTSSENLDAFLETTATL
jgi:uroporphyrinogen-III decarboxylase